MLILVRRHVFCPRIDIGAGWCRTATAQTGATTVHELLDGPTALHFGDGRIGQNCLDAGTSLSLFFVGHAPAALIGLMRCRLHLVHVDVLVEVHGCHDEQSTIYE